MDFFNFTLILTFASGVVLIMYSAYNFYDGTDKKNVDESFSLEDNIENKLKAIDSSVADADNAIGELSEMSSSMFKELEEKYQELLFLYNLLDEKKSEILPGGNRGKNVKVAEPENINVLINDITSKGYKNPKLKEIKELKDGGLSIAQIAKKLNMGQGEVSLILELGKGRRVNA